MAMENRPEFAYIEGQRVVIKSTGKVGTVMKRLWHEGGARYTVVLATGGRVSWVNEQNIDKHWFKAGEIVFDIEQSMGEVYSHVGNVVEVKYGGQVTHLRKAWAEWQVYPVIHAAKPRYKAGDLVEIKGYTAQVRSHVGTTVEVFYESLQCTGTHHEDNVKPAPPAVPVGSTDAEKMISYAKDLEKRLAESGEELSKTRVDLLKTTEERDAFHKANNELALASDRASKEVERLKDELALSRPVVLSGFLTRIDYDSSPRMGAAQNISLQINTGAGVVDISTKTIDPGLVKALYGLYSAQAKRQGMVTVTIAAK